MNIQERFLKYVSFPTMSDEESETTPSTKKQLTLANYLVQELHSLGIENAHVDEYGYVYAFIDGNVECDETLGLIAHMDTSCEAPDSVINARIVHFDGEKILLNEEKGIYLSAENYPDMLKHKNEDLIVTDGTTLLGADDKAGICEIISAVEYVLKNDLPHGKISLCFTPDEEIGRGANCFDVKKFGADYAYTVDGSVLGTVEYENFNAASAVIKVSGIGIHPGCAKGKMINASSLACEFESLMPKDEKPETTEEYEGFYHLVSMSGDVENAVLKYIIRDHDKKKFEKRKEFIKKHCTSLNEKYGKEIFSCTVKDSYYNMAEIIKDNMYIVDRAKAAIEQNGIKAETKPIRGGTDGARLSFMGLPCPNLCTGAENYHSRFEYISVQSLETVTRIITSIITDVIYKAEEDFAK